MIFLFFLEKELSLRRKFETKCLFLIVKQFELNKYELKKYQ